MQTATSWYVRVSRKPGADKAHETDYAFRVVGEEEGGAEPETPEGA